MKQFLLFIIGFLLSFQTIAQSPHIPMTDYHQSEIERSEPSSNFHPAIKPFNSFEVGKSLDSLYEKLRLQSAFASASWFGKRLFNENLVHIKNEDYNIIINPILNVSVGKDNNLPDSTFAFNNTRGFYVMGNIGHRFKFYSDFRENQARLPFYLDEFVRAKSVIPSGQGKPKVFKGGEVFDFASASGYISFQPNKYFNFNLGQGKHFLGEGYRSLLLSDNTFNYPYLRIAADVWKLKYMILYTKMLDVNYTNPDDTYISKYITSHYLSYNITSKLNIGVFETIVYQDSLGTRGYDLNYLNPVIFFRPVEFALGSGGGNVLLGFNGSWQFYKKYKFYTQFILDEFNFTQIKANNGWWANKYGIQLGVKGLDIIPGLDGLVEYNNVRPFTYSHRSSLQNYGHYNEPLAHPLGANFRELILKLDYRLNRYYTGYKMVSFSKGYNNATQNWGGDIYESYSTRELEFGNKTLQGDRADVMIHELKLGWIINPAYNLRVEAGVRIRNSKSDVAALNYNTNYIYLRMATDLSSRYYDF